MRELAVVIIGRNEEQHLARCIRSVLTGTESFSDTQIVYVDSASTDRSVEIARQFPVDIVRLKDDWFLSAAAGRFTGFFQSESKFIFFIDGDSVVFTSWLEKGIRFLKRHPQIAAVAGIVHENMLDADGRIERLLHNRYDQRREMEEVRTLGGIALYRREILDQSGPFNPYITVDEERELALRIRRLGYGLLVRLLQPMAITYGPSRESVREIFRRFHTHLYTFGRTLRYCQAEGFFWQYTTERLSFITTTLLGLLAGLLVVSLSIRAGKGILLLALPGLIVIFVLLKRKRLPEIWTSILKRLVMTVRTVETYFTTRPIPMEMYPKDVLILQKAKKNGTE